MNARQADRLIVITDEQSHQPVPGSAHKAYMINVASAQRGIGYGPWTHIDGFSEAVLSFIAAIEAPTQEPALMAEWQSTAVVTRRRGSDSRRGLHA